MVKIFIIILALPLTVVGRKEAWIEMFGMKNVPFHAWMGDRAATPIGVLVLVPGYNGQGEAILDDQWKKFTIENNLALLAPTFRAEGMENNSGKGYYYPEQGSGEVLERALAKLNRRTGVQTDRILIFGFSAGAHFGHRFALWKPQRVKAFVAYSAGWWSEPTAAIRKVPALIMWRSG